MKSTVELITDFLFICEESAENLNSVYDLVIVCGNDSIEATITAVEQAYKNSKLANNVKVILSGNIGTLNAGKSPEAIRMYDCAVEKGLPNNLFLLESKATNARENFIFSKELLEMEKITFENSKILVICKSFMSLRAKMCASAVGFNTNNIDFLGVVDTAGRNIGKTTWHLSEESKQRVYAEIERIGKYSLKGDLSI